MKEIIKNPFLGIFTTFAKDFIASHFLINSPKISRADNPI